MSGIVNSAGSRSGVIGTTELDYEEGTYTATCSNGVLLHSGVDLVAYTKIGRMVTVGAQIRIYNDNSTSDLSISIPFTSAATDGESSGYYTCSPRLYNFDVSSDCTYVIGYIGGNSALLEVLEVRDNAVAIAVNAKTDAYFMWSITYRAA